MRYRICRQWSLLQDFDTTGESGDLRYQVRGILRITQFLSITERTREIGLLRAIGMQRTQLRQMVATEAVIICAIGALLGIVLGVGLGAALAAALTTSRQATVAIPAGQLVVYILATAAAGVLASIGPARRVGRLDMLTAIAAE